MEYRCGPGDAPHLVRRVVAVRPQTTTMTQNDNTLRAVFLAALMFLWLFAGTVAFAGGAAAQSADSLTVDSADLSPDDAFDTESTHEFTHTLEVGSNANVDTITLDYSAGTFDTTNQEPDASNAEELVLRVDGDEVSGASINSGASDATTVEIDADSAAVSSGNNTVEVTLENITNPGPGTYDIDVTATLDSGNSVSTTGQYEVREGLDADSSFATDQSLRYQGQELYVQLDTENFEDFRLIEYDQTASDFRDATGDTVRELTPDTDRGGRTIDTDDLEGAYAITASNGNNRVAIETNDAGVQTGGTQSVSDEPWLEVVVQELDAEFEEDNPDLGTSTDLEVSSGRANYDLVISEDNLSQDELGDIFSGSSEEGDDNITVEGISEDADIDAEFDEDDFSEGEEFDFTVEAEDSTADGSATVTLGSDLDASATFDEGQITEARGDVFTVAFETSEVTDDKVNLTFGDIDDTGVEATYNVEVNDDGEAELEFNTFTFLRDANDVTQGVTAEEGNIDETNSSIEVSGTADSLDTVLAGGLYDLSVEETDEDGNELGVAVVDLTERENTEMTIHAYPNNAGISEIDDLDGIQEALNEGSLAATDEIAVQDPDRTEDGETAEGDLIVHRIVASGLEGAFAEQRDTTDTDLEALAALEQDTDRDPDSGVYLDFFQSTGSQNVGGFSATLTGLVNNDIGELVTDADNDTYYLIVNTDDMASISADAVEPGSPYQVNFSVTPAFINENFRDDRNRLDVEEQNEDVVGNTFTIVDREVSFNTVNSEVVVEPVEEAEISGTTTIAAGTDITVRARAEGESPFLKTADATVGEDGSFSGEFDFSDVESGQAFLATVRNQDFDESGETDGTVGQAEFASVTLNEITATEGETVDTITVESAFLPNGNGFVTIHDGTLLDGEVIASVRGTSEYLDSENPQSIEVSLDTPYEEDGTAIAMPHQDTNDNEEYDFVDTEGSEDGPYVGEDGNAVTDDASVTFEAEETATPEPTETATPEPTDTPTEDGTETGSDGQPGFGAVVALVALLGAALLAARRRSLE
jgi:PGF-CTERM protein/surface glycoprotein (TIGR04207 family)